MLKTGMIIAERYEIVEKIGTGGMADVYKATDHKLDRFVAVKVLKAEFREDKQFIRKFRSEAQAAAGLAHANIVNIFDVGDDDGVYYIVMELIEGITLKDYILRKGKLSVKESTSIAIQVSMGLESAHSHGIVHRDVKPQNIIISKTGKVKVTDFGIARAASSNTISSNVMGSVHYSSPEQVRGGYSDEKSDIYSLGITLYEMVTGKVPFDGDTTVAIAIKHLQEEITAPSVYTKELPYSLEQIIYKCTQKSVERRYKRMEDVIADLKRSLIDPNGKFVTFPEVNNHAQTRVFSDNDLKKIKESPKQVTLSNEPEEVLQVKDDSREYREEENSKLYQENVKKQKKNHSDFKRHAVRGLTMGALLLGAAVMIVLIIFISRAAGLIGGNADPTPKPQQQAQETDNLVEVPDLLGKTEEEAKALAKEVTLGTQMIGEQASSQEKGRICAQDIPAGTRVEPYSTLKYYVSKGAVSINVPDLDGRTGIDGQQILEDMGLIVEIDRQYSEVDYNGYPMVEPGYVYYTVPETGTSVKSGDTITLVISRGVDYGSSVEVPSVVGMSKNDALTTLGKFIDIQILEQMSTEVPAGEVIAQSPEGYAWANPDEVLTLTISTGNTEPEVQTPDEQQDLQILDGQQDLQIPDGQQETTGEEVWKCTQKLNTPDGYTGGPVRLELLQEINGEPSVTLVLEGQTLTFPYKLDLTGASGVSEGTLYVAEQIDGSYQDLGSYNITFKKAE